MNKKRKNLTDGPILLNATTGKRTPVEPANGTNFAGKELYRLLNCRLVERIFLGNGTHCMWVDGDGLVVDEENIKENYWASMITGQRIVGNALICRIEEVL